MQISNIAWYSVFSDILRHSVAPVVIVIVAGHNCTYETQQWLPCFTTPAIPLTVKPIITAKVTLAFSLFSGFAPISTSQYPIPWIIFQSLPSNIIRLRFHCQAQQLLEYFVSVDSSVFHDFSPAVFQCWPISRRWSFTTDGVSIFVTVVHIHEFWLRIKCVL